MCRILGLTLLTQVIEKYKKPMSTRVRIHCGFQTLWQYDNNALLFGLKVINILMGDLYTQCEIYIISVVLPIAVWEVPSLSYQLT